MTKLFKILSFLTLIVVFASCTTDNKTATIIPPREYPVQYLADLDSIDKYIDTHYMTVDSDYNVTFTKIPVGGTQPSIRLQTSYPLLNISVNNEDHNVDYKVYYIKLREGSGDNPSGVDSVYVSYKGNLINDSQFDYAPNPVWFPLQTVVPGWAEIIPLFKTGTYDATVNENPVAFDNYGAGILFLPSGLGYYNAVPSSVITPYSPLIFSFKLRKLRYRDHDRDGILSKDEVDPAVIGQKPIDYDSDGDGFANMYDVDDDDDHFLTRNERKRPYILENGVLKSNGYYPYNGAAVDDPLTPNIDERQGMPRKFSGPIDAVTQLPTPLPSDFTDPTRMRRHLDKTSYPPFQ